MLWLPRFAKDRVRQRIAMASPTAQRVEWALLDENHDRRTATFESLLADDPGLLYWAVVHADLESAAPCSCLDDVARWLAGCLLRVLHWQAGESPPWTQSAETEHCYADRAARTVTAAWLAERLAAEEDQRLDPRQVRFAVLLSGAVRWLAVKEVPEPEDSALSLGPRHAPNGDDLDEWVERFDDRLTAMAAGEREVCRGVMIRAWKTAMSLPEPAGEPAGFGGDSDEAGPPESPRDCYERALRSWRTIDLAVGDRLVRLAGRLRRLESEFEAAVETEKLQAMKELAYGASHEINNPLANISLRAQMLLRDETDPERQKALATIHAQAMRAHEMIADLMHFARPPRLKTSRFDLAALVDKVLAECRSAAKTCGTDVELYRAGASDDVWIVADAEQLAVAIRALCDNALEAVGCGGQVHVEIRAAVAAGNSEGWVELDVTDNGPGIADEIRPRIFDPFFSGREAGRGLGFGLSKAWRIVTDHGGSIAVGKRPSGGALLTVRLPAAERGGDP